MENTNMGNTDDFWIENGVLKRYWGRDREVIIPYGVTSIGNNAFERCESIRSVMIPEGVTIIGWQAFAWCKSLKSITIPESVRSIRISAFRECVNLTSVTLPEGVTDIGRYAFFMCSSLTNITIPDSAIIDEGAFYGCKGLADQEGFVIVRDVLYGYFGPGGEVIIPDGVKTIGFQAFYKYKNLTGVTIPSGVTKIGENAFPWSVSEVICNTPYAASYFEKYVLQALVYLGGPLTDLPEKQWKEAAMGLMYALEHGITEIDPWRETYLEYIRSHIRDFIEAVQSRRSVLLFLIREEMLDDEKEARRLLDIYGEEGDTEAKAFLLQYIHDRFGSGSEDLTF